MNGRCIGERTVERIVERIVLGRSCPGRVTYRLLMFVVRPVLRPLVFVVVL